MRTSFVLELHREWSEFADECIGLWLLKNSLLQKSSENRSRQDALQTICWGCLDIFYPQICTGFLRF
jgi:hypothetical protein